MKTRREFTVEEKKALKDKFKKAAEFVRDNVATKNQLGQPKAVLSQNYWLESLDPHHREREYLWKNRDLWMKDKATTDNFFTWLDKKEATEGKTPQSLHYFTDPESRQEYRAHFADGLIKNEKGEPFDTVHFKGKAKGYAAYVINDKGEMFIGQHVKGKLHHSSFTGGSKVVCAGMVKIENGKILDINNNSGHYKPMLRNLNAGIKAIPRDVFDKENGKVSYTKIRWPALGNFLANAPFSWIRKIGRALQKPSIIMQGKPDEFLNYSSLQLEKEHQIPLNIRDRKGNRAMVTLYESLLAKSITEAPETWEPVVNKINKSILEHINDNKGNKHMEKKLRNYLKNIPTDVKGSGDVYSQIDQFLKNKDLSQTVLFHKDFFEDIYPHLKQGKEQIDSGKVDYKGLRVNQYFGKDERGRETVRSQKWCPVTSYKMGIGSAEYTPEALKNYYQDKPGLHQPGLSYFKFKGERASAEEARQNRSQYDGSLPYAEQVSRYDIPFVAGPSGTVSKIIPALSATLNLSEEEKRSYLMALSGALVANGHHSFYEVMVLANKMGMETKYDGSFYAKQVLTKEFKTSEAFKKFDQEFPEQADKIFHSKTATKESATIAKELDSTQKILLSAHNNVDNKEKAIEKNAAKAENEVEKIQTSNINPIVDTNETSQDEFSYTKQKTSIQDVDAEVKQLISDARSNLEKLPHQDGQKQEIQAQLDKISSTSHSGL